MKEVLAVYILLYMMIGVASRADGFVGTEECVGVVDKTIGTDKDVLCPVRVRGVRHV